MRRRETCMKLKNLTAVLMAAIMTFGAVGCGGQASTPADTGAEAEDTVQIDEGSTATAAKAGVEITVTTTFAGEVQKREL